MHLSLRDEIRSKVENSDEPYVVFDAGTHIGYVHYPPNYAVDFGVTDRNKDSGLTQDRYEGENIQVNPFDYFTDELKQSILEKYQPIYDALKQEGVTPCSKLEDSRSNTNIKDTIWGIWFKDDVSDPSWNPGNWVVINLLTREYIHQETFWKILQDNPTLAGILTESSSGQKAGKPLYDGDPLASSRFFILSGDEKEGVAKIVYMWGDQTVYLKCKVEPNTEIIFDDKLIMESFSTQAAAETSSFSDRAVTFRREP